ncbi:MAG TPA: YihY/virulence factor BrkB family protein [Solirubrobacteraceae bacterium]|jgi:YihY family inner membrane protein|nr:YihY/virulence factor BrkB family protein [Solirubrobacteraceae bacterium]
MNLRARLEVFDRYQQGHRWLAIPFAVVRKFSDDQAGSLAALVAYYGFFSLFPLLLVFVTILGYVLAGDPGAQQSVQSGVLGQFPIIGADIQKNIHALHGNATSLIVGILGSLWGGLAVTNASQNAFNKVWAVPHRERPNFLQTRLRGLGVLALLGVLFMVSSLASGLVAGGLGGTWAKVGGIAVSLLVNVLLFLAAFRLLTSAQIETRCLIQGVLVASVLWEVLQIIGGLYVRHVLSHADATYGVFGTVIGLLSWLYLGGQVTLYAAEINVVRARRLWPRSLFHDPPTIGDEETLKAIAKVEERIEGEKIDVTFGAPPENE